MIRLDEKLATSNVGTDKEICALGIAMHVLFLNTGTGRNLGDRAMLLNVARLARGQHPEAMLRVSSDVPSWLTEEFNLHAAPALIHIWGRWDAIATRLGLRAGWARALAPAYRMFCTMLCGGLVVMPRVIRRWVPGMEGEFLQAVASTDLVYFTGGGYLTDAGTTEARAILLTALMARMRGARIVMTGQGIGPFSTRLTQWLGRQVAARCDVLVTREVQSAAYWFERWGLPSQCWEGGVDDACSLPYLASELQTRSKSLAVHFRISPFHAGAASLLASFLEIIRSHLAAGYTVKLFVFQEASGAELDTYIEWLAALKSDAVSVVRDSDPRVVRAELASCDRAVGLAYHFLLFALMSGLPAVAIYANEYYKAKFSGLATLFDRPECLMAISKVDAAAILQRLEGMDAAHDTPERMAAAVEHAAACDRQVLSALHAGRNPSLFI